MRNKKQSISHHKKNVVKHTEERARERYDLWFPDQIKYILQEIKNFRKDGNMTIAINHGIACNVMFLYRENRNPDRYHYLVEWRNKFYWPVWSNELQTINTFLPLEALKRRIGYMPNAVVGFLSAKNLININEYKQFEVKRVIHQPNRKEFLTNEEYWNVGVFAHSDPDTPHHLDHNQPEQSLDDHHDSPHHTMIDDQNLPH
jgi:hypothetical protein